MAEMEIAKGQSGPCNGYAKQKQSKAKQARPASSALVRGVSLSLLFRIPRRSRNSTSHLSPYPPTAATPLIGREALPHASDDVKVLRAVVFCWSAALDLVVSCGFIGIGHDN